MTADIYIDDKKKGVFFYFVELNATLVKENPFLRSSIFFLASERHRLSRSSVYRIRAPSRSSSPNTDRVTPMRLFLAFVRKNKTSDAQFCGVDDGRPFRP